MINRLISIGLLSIEVGLTLPGSYRESAYASEKQQRTAAASKTPSSIRSVDFSNFVYPIIWLPADEPPTFRVIRTFGLQNVELKNGVFEPEVGPEHEPVIRLKQIGYGDVTGDGMAEAIVALSAHNGGTQSWGFLYIYSMASNKPKLLEAFMTGDRAYEGLCRAYASGGDLIIELYDPDNRLGDCCATQISRARYKWYQEHFSQVGKKVIENLPKDSVPNK